MMRIFCQGNIFFYIVFYLVILTSQAFSVGTNPIRVPQDCISIQAAIDAATHGDRIIVSPGIYYENIHFKGKNIKLRSQNPQHLPTVEQTQIDGQSKGSVVTFAGTESPDCHLYGFTISNGSAENGGGINGNSSKSWIEWNRIIDNFASDRGGGIYRAGYVYHNRIFNNKAGNYGGGLSNVYVSRLNLVYENEAMYGGGMAYTYGHICTIYGNTAYQDGGGTYGVSAPDGSIIWGNQALEGLGDEAYINSDHMQVIMFSWVTPGGTYSSPGHAYQWYDAYADPGFVDPENGDFHLRPDSPALIGVSGGGQQHSMISKASDVNSMRTRIYTVI
jgi:hypothetical protein